MERRFAARRDPLLAGAEVDPRILHEVPGPLRAAVTGEAPSSA